MILSTEELTCLKDRCLTAAHQGYKVARIDSHIANLKLETGDIALPSDSLQAAVVLIDTILAIRSGKMKPLVRPFAPLPKVVEAVPAIVEEDSIPVEEPIVEAAVEETVVEEVTAPVEETVVEEVTAPVEENVAATLRVEETVEAEAPQADEAPKHGKKNRKND